MDILLILLLGVALYLFVLVVEWWIDARKPDPVYARIAERQRALDALASFSQSEKIDATDRCKTCGSPILTENTPFGYCEDCVMHLAVEDGGTVVVYCLPLHEGIDVTRDFAGPFTLLPPDSYRLDYFDEMDDVTVAYLVSDGRWCDVHGVAA